MPEVVAEASGPQGQAAPSWNVLETPSASQRTGAVEFGEQEDKSEAESAKTEESHESRERDSGQEQSEREQQREPEGKKTEKLTRYERQKRKRAALEAREASIAQREREFAEKERAASEAQARANQPPYTLAELREYRKTWEKEGNYDLCDKADAEIERLEKLEADRKQTFEVPKAGTPEFMNQWQAAEKEIYDLDPEFQREGTRLDKLLRAMMSGPEGHIFRQHPRGIVAAYHKARLDLAEADLSSAKAEIAKLKAENARLNGHLSIGASGAAGRSVADLGERDFANLSTKEMRDYLKRRAAGNGHW